MPRRIFIAMLICLSTCSVSSGEEWARKMFDGLDHDFGHVARGSKVEHRFVITNLYQEDVHIAAVRSNCGCTDPEITQETLTTYEKGEIVAKFNTRTFLGHRTATLTVTIDQPYYAEVQLHVEGYVRSDVVLQPAGVNLGNIDRGAAVEKKLTVNYAGRNDWKIEGVKSGNPHLEAEVAELSRGGGQVSYELTVRLKDDAPAGYINEQLTVTTNDQRAKEFPVDVEGRIAAEVAISPASLYLGSLKPGEQVTKQLVVKGKQPFKIVGVSCDDPAFQFAPPDVSKPLHLVPVTFTAGDKPGKVSRKIRIETDLGDDVAPECVAYAQVVAE